MDSELGGIGGCLVASAPLENRCETGSLKISVGCTYLGNCPKVEYMENEIMESCQNGGRLIFPLGRRPRNICL